MITEEEVVLLPDYLKGQENINHYYGKLYYENDFWIIRGEPIVCQYAKRLFPGCEGRGRNIAKFKANKRIIGDLNWLMLRFPLEIENEVLWKKTIEKTREHVFKREHANKFPLKVDVDNSLLSADLLDYQKEGLGFLLTNRRCVLADEMGLGKTVQALSFLSNLNSFPALIIVPPHLITNWKDEISKFLKLKRENGEYEEPVVHQIKGLRPYELPKADIYITHYLVIRGWKRILPNIQFETVIFDEVQELRHSGTEKYSTASLIAENAENVIGLSGTPIYNRGGEIWNIMNIIDFQCLGDWDSFTREWCYGYGNDIVTDPVLLGEHLKREGLLFRRRKEDVLKELPPKRRVVQHVDSDEKVFSTLIANAVKQAKLIDGLETVFERNRVSRQIANETRQVTGIAKAPFVCDFVKMLLESGEKVILFAFHHAVFDIYKEKLKEYNPVFITGRENEIQKGISVVKFRKGESNICCISLRAASGLNLQQATCVVFGELDWSPAIHSQGEDRAHRIGQTDSVLCYYLVSTGGSDEEIQEALGMKVSQFRGLMGDRLPTEEDEMLNQTDVGKHIKKIIEKLKSKAS